MERTYARNWWAIALRGGVAMMFGLLASAFADATPEFLGRVFGVFLLVEGALAAVSGLGARTAEDRAYVSWVEGALGLGFALVLLSGIHEGSTVIRLVAGWIAAIGILEGASSISFRKHVAAPRLLIGIAVVSVLLAGALWMFAPPTLVAVWFIGAWAVFAGATTLAVSVALRADVGANQIHLFDPTAE
ncbi:MAG: HdeD family acid-resistance protein [Polyangiales bacterium]